MIESPQQQQDDHASEARLGTAAGQLAFAMVYNGLFLGAIAAAVAVDVPPTWMVVTGLFGLGAAIGSWLNVVVYRMPRGLDLDYPPSHCPRCLSPIRRYHNVPIISWLVLAGRCAACRQPISLRYPGVELTVAVGLAGLLLAESHIANNPSSRIPSVSILSTAGLIAGRTAYHGLLLVGLLTAALMAWDGWAVPSRLGWRLSGLGLVLPLLWPELRPFGLPERTSLSASVDGLAGAAVAAAGAVLLWPSRGRDRPTWPVIWVGVFLGWPAGLALPVLARVLGLFGLLAGAALSAVLLR